MNLSSKILALLLVCAAIVLIVWGVRLIVPPATAPLSALPDTTLRASGGTHTYGYSKYPARAADSTRYKHSKYPRYPRYPRKEYPKTKIEINSADSATLTQIRGIGPTFARRIINYRTRLGGFRNTTQLLQIKGIDSLKLQELTPQIKLDTTLCQRFDLRTCHPQTIRSHPYVSASLSKRLLKRRASLGEMIAADAVLPAEAEAIGPYFF